MKSADENCERRRIGRGKKGRKKGRKAIIFTMYKIKKTRFFKGKIAEECQVDIPEVEEILKEIEDL